jgi:hypothetical protein
METNLSLLLKENSNPFTKAAFLEIAQRIFIREEKARRLIEMVFDVCFQDISEGVNLPVGRHLYLEQAASLILATIEHNPGWRSTEDNEELLALLLRNENEEVVLKCLFWMKRVKLDFNYSERIQTELQKLINQDKWDGIAALALQTISFTADADVAFGLEECIHGIQKEGIKPLKEGWISVSGIQKEGIKPLKEGWISVSGYAARMVPLNLVPI